MSGRRTIALGLAAASGFLFASGATAADTEVIGGSGGKPFRAECPAGEYLTGFQLWTGKRINAAAPLCAPLPGDIAGGNGIAQKPFGTTAGSSEHFSCAGNTYLASITVHQARKNPVNAIELSCRMIEDPEIFYTVCGNTGEPCQGKAVACANGEAATGVHGRASKGLDAIGLICGPRPTPVAPAPVTPEPAPTAEGPAPSEAASATPAQETATPPSDVAERPAQWVPPNAEIVPPEGALPKSRPAEAMPSNTAAEAPPPKPAQWVPPVAETVPFHGEPYLAEIEAAAGAPAPEAETPGMDIDADIDDAAMARRLPSAPPPEAAMAPPPAPIAPAMPMPRPEAATAPPAAAAAPPPVRSLATKKAAAPRPAEATPAAAPPDGDGKWRLVPVFFGTDRAQVQNPKRLTYGYGRARKLEIGRALVSVPTSHQAPNVERPWALTIPGTSIKLYEEEEDPAKHFTLREIKTLSSEEFLKLVKERLKVSKDYKDQALIFIHGYNSSFENAVYRTAQLAHDIAFDGAPFLYSWPSRGELSGYTYDRASNEQAEPFMREFVEMVIKKSGAKSVNVVAHSMGNQLTVRVLQQLKTANVKINQIILAAPDVDRDSFENIAKELKGLSKGITLYAAANDKALIASKTFHGGVARAGDVPTSGPVVVEGVDTIDVTTLSTDTLGLNHSTYAEKTALIDDIGRLLKTGTRPPLKRTPVLTRVPAGKMEYWKFPAP